MTRTSFPPSLSELKLMLGELVLASELTMEHCPTTPQELKRPVQEFTPGLVTVFALSQH